MSMQCIMDMLHKERSSFRMVFTMRTRWSVVSMASTKEGPSKGGGGGGRGHVVDGDHGIIWGGDLDTLEERREGKEKCIFFFFSFRALKKGKSLYISNKNHILESEIKNYIKRI